MSFTHETVQHKLQRRNQDLVEQIGARNPTFSYTLAMREDLFKGPYKRMFTEGLQGLLDDFRDKSPGELVDPIYGVIRCVPSSYNDDSDNNKRDGTDVRVELIQSPEDEEDDIVATPTASGVTKDADSLNVAVQEVTADPIVAEEIGPQQTGNLKDLLQSYATFGRQVLALPNDLRSQAAQIAYWAKEIEAVVEDAHDPGRHSAELYRVQQLARQARDTALRSVSQAGSVNPVRVVFVEQDQSLSSLAARYGVPLETLIKANRELVSRPSIAAGTQLIIPNVRR